MSCWKRVRRFMLGCCGGRRDDQEEDTGIDDLRHPDNQAFLREQEQLREQQLQREQQLLREQQFATRGYRYVCSTGDVVYLRHPPPTIQEREQSEGALQDEALSSGTTSISEDDDMIESKRETYWDTLGPESIADALADDKSSCGSIPNRGVESDAAASAVPGNSVDANGVGDAGDEEHHSICPPETLDADDKDEGASMSLPGERNQDDGERTEANGSHRATGISEEHFRELTFSPRRVPRVARRRTQVPAALSFEPQNTAGRSQTMEKGSKLMGEVVRPTESAGAAATIIENMGCGGNVTTTKAAVSAVQVTKIPTLADNREEFWKLFRSLCAQLDGYVRTLGPKDPRPDNWKTHGFICRFLFPAFTDENDVPYPIPMMLRVDEAIIKQTPLTQQVCISRPAPPLPVIQEENK